MSISNWWNTTWRRKLCGNVACLIHADSFVKIGHQFTCDGIPSIWRTAQGRVEIGDNVYIRRDVEIRVHKDARVIIGDNVKIDRGVRILATGNAVVNIGEGCSIGLYSVLNGKDNITLGEKVLVSGFVYLQASMHNYDQQEAIKDLGSRCDPIVISKESWIGAHAVVMPGVKMGIGAVLGANAVLTKDVEDYCIYGGVPAKFIKYRY